LQSTNFEFINHDLTKPINLEDYREAKKFKIEFYGVSEIYHLACPTSSKDSSKLAFDTVFANSHSTKTLLDIAEKYNSKVFFASSSSVYGAPTEGEYLINEKYKRQLNQHLFLNQEIPENIIRFENSLPSKELNKASILGLHTNPDKAV
jgi:nucleoside-diphosphate-sugar epimerase